MQTAQHRRAIHTAPELARLSNFATLDRQNACFISPARSHLNQIPIGIVDPMAQCAEAAGGRIVPSHGADSGDALL